MRTYYAGCNYNVNDGRNMHEPKGTATSMHECGNCGHAAYCRVKKRTALWEYSGEIKEEMDRGWAETKEIARSDRCAETGDSAQASAKFALLMLSRLAHDCERYLGPGGGDPSSLWGKSVESHIRHMKRLWEGFGENEKPERVTWGDILRYEKEMTAKDAAFYVRMHVFERDESDDRLLRILAPGESPRKVASAVHETAEWLAEDMGTDDPDGLIDEIARRLAAERGWETGFCEMLKPLEIGRN